jgi:hypothetical protein
MFAGRGAWGTSAWKETLFSLRPFLSTEIDSAVGFAVRLRERLRSVLLR